MSAPISPIAYSYPDAAALLGLTPGALRDLVYKGRGPAVVRIGRRTLFAASDLAAWIEAHRVPAPPSPEVSAIPRRRRGRPTKASQLMIGKSA
ncbi:helix-turn-helix domain-containing protein [Azospirillum thermophilum]|uniref:Helix-turn-helix domain-containing protein n=1 Tax=Azospirillum thermophilum TaxID=2202148 RepID=A0A2S2CKI0_9PROT|nr:helix-turn-helix domain-containing protein [Azospirillum thermophilum]AWK85001.1 hypothetical protein DEW08_01335 [Azospirillum thermophilum]